jgi:hypothetical protein
MSLILYYLKLDLSNPDGYSLTNQILNLFSKNHQFESHRFQGN